MASATTSIENTASIESTPQAGQNVNVRGTTYTTIKEGLGYILVPYGTPTSTDPKLSKEDTQRQSVFYNPIQQFNRDLSVLAIKAYGEDCVARKKAKADKSHKRSVEKLKRKQQKSRAQDHEANENSPDGAPTKKRRTDEEGNAVAAAVAVAGATDTVHANIPPPDSEAQVSSIDSSADTDSKAPSISFRILDALSATGLRALRYAQEIPFLTSVTANDMSEKATNSITLNVTHNKLGDKITVHTGNAIAYMYSFVDKPGFDVIDLDPYGTAAPFLDAAVQALHDGGLLCVTCTDSAIFASHGYLEKTYSQYGGLPLKGEACHEGGLRLLLHAIASSAGRYGLAIEPLLSLSIDYYIRVFVRVRKSPNDVKMLAGKTMIVYNCDSGCGSWTQQFLARHLNKSNRTGDTVYKHSFAQAPSASQQCPHCGQKTHLSGPMYGGPLHNPAFIKRVLDYLPHADETTYPTKVRIEGMLRTAHDEMSFGVKNKTFSYVEKPENFPVPKMDPAELDRHPFFFIPSAISRVLHCQAPSTAAFRGALLQAGFMVTMSHCKPGSIKTDADWRQIWHILREWVRQKAPLKNALKEGTPGWEIMRKGEISSNTKDHVHAQTETVSDDTRDPNDGDGKQNDGANTLSAPNSAKLQAVAPSEPDVSFKVVFDEVLGKDHDRGKIVRYQLAPRENWGPMSRAK